MNISNKNINKKKQTQPQGQSSAAPAAIKAKTIKLGVDVHLDLFVVTRIIDGSTPQPAQRFKPVEFLLWCAKQRSSPEIRIPGLPPSPLHVYATAHSKLGKSTPEYVRQVMTSGKDSADGVLIYCHQDPKLDPEKYQIIKELFGQWPPKE